MADYERTVPRDELIWRICCEYKEMPGLRLTTKQAQRLWGLDPATCGDVLRELVASSFLSCSTDGYYTKASERSSAFPKPRMAQANLDPKPFPIERIS
jgi:hypothetical protein